MWREVAYFLMPNGKKRQVYCNKKSIRQSEFHQAGLNDLKPEIMLEVRSNEYNGEPYIFYNEIKHVIYRTYEKGDITELYLTIKAGEF